VGSLFFNGIANSFLLMLRDGLWNMAKSTKKTDFGKMAIKLTLAEARFTRTAIDFA
jgi:hypothetical protein